MKGFPIELIQDSFSLCGLGIPTATLSAGASSYFKKRKDMLREAILSEIRGGDFSRINEDDKIAIVIKLSQSAMEGVAKNNLYLMCQVIAGMEQKNSLTAPLFLRYAPMLATLSDDEIIFLGIMAKYHPLSPEKSRHERDKVIRKAMGSKMEAIQSALLRTGLLVLAVDSKTTAERGMNLGHNFDNVMYSYIDQTPMPNLEYHTKTTASYNVTPLMDEILEYTQFILKDNN
jgi:hypothetical protein